MHPVPVPAHENRPRPQEPDPGGDGLDRSQDGYLHLQDRGRGEQRLVVRPIEGQIGRRNEQRRTDRHQHMGPQTRLFSGRLPLETDQPAERGRYHKPQQNPKFQAHEVGEPVEVSVNCTGCPALGD